MRSADPLLRGAVWQYESTDSGITWERFVWKAWEGPANQRSKQWLPGEKNLPVVGLDKVFLQYMARKFIGPGKPVRLGSVWNVTGDKKYDDNETYAGFVYPRDKKQLSRKVKK